MSLDLEDKKQMIEKVAYLSISRQCELLELNRSSFYYQAKPLGESDYRVMRRIDEIFTEHPYWYC